MKNSSFVLIAFSICLSLLTPTVTSAQLGTISTYANISACNIAVDNVGRVYTASGSRIYRVDSGGSTTTVVGGGSSYGDGGPATAAQLVDATNLEFDPAGNMYIADHSYGVIRKVNTSGIISTVAGNHLLGPGYTGDGGPATAARVNCINVCLDGFGNIFIADETDYVIRKVNSSGIITTVAGNGTAGYSGDGGPATAAALDNSLGSNIWGIATDILGNLYISAINHYRVRRVTPGGIITTFAGNGSTGSSGVGGPATAANVYYPQGLTSDAAGSLYIAEWQNCVLSYVDPAGIFNTLAGNHTISFSGDGGPATAAGMNAVSDVAIDPNGNIYIADCHNNRIRKVIGSYLSSTYVADSFGVTINKFCSGPQLRIISHTYSSAYSVKCYFGDGSFTTSALSPGLSGSGFVAITHTYANPGTYTLKTVLMNSGIPFDSISYSFEYKMCNTLSTQYYYDANSNCSKDAGEPSLSQPVLVEIDSNGIAIDTISTTGGIYYTAYGIPGDIYAFKVISSPGNMHPTCPSSGIVTDTLQTLSYNTNLRSVAMQCFSGTDYDLALHPVVPVTGVRDQWGNIYVSNAHCAPQSATVTLHYDRHYQARSGSMTPAASSFTDSTITWNVSSLSSIDAKPVQLYYAIWRHPDSAIVVGYPARSYYTVSPIVGDVDTSDNNQIRVDTVNGGVNPNDISVTPQGYITAGTQLEYTIHFTNTGNDTTYNIYVMDTLSDNLDVSSFRIVMSPEQMNIYKFNSGGHTILKFDFPDINLLDSIHHPDDCMRGFVYTINAKAGLPDGTTIDNHAGIFFDFNPVVTTNTVQNIIGLPGLNTVNPTTDNIVLYPNPAHTILHVNNLAIATTYAITNLLGAVVHTGELKPGSNDISVTDLPPGIFFIKIKGIGVKKFSTQ